MLEKPNFSRTLNPVQSCFLILPFILAMLATTSALAADIVWDGGHGNWTDANWNGGRTAMDVFGRTNGFELGTGEIGSEVLINLIDGDLIYDADDLGSFRFLTDSDAQGGTLTVVSNERGSVFLITSSGLPTHFNGDTLNLDSGRISRNNFQPGVILPPGIFSLGGEGGTDNMDIKVNITNDGKIENRGPLTFGWYGENHRGRKVTMTINDGIIECGNKGDADYLDGAFGGAGNGALQFHFGWDEVANAPIGEEYAINFTGPGLMVVGESGIIAPVQTGPGDLDYDLSSITTLLSYEDLWDMGILQAHGESAVTGATFSDFFSVRRTIGGSTVLTSLVSPVPEPGSGGMLMVAFLGMCGIARRRRSSLLSIRLNPNPTRRAEPRSASTNKQNQLTPRFGPTQRALRLAVTCSMALAGGTAQSAEFIPLGMLPDVNHSSAFGISPDGNYVVGRSGTMSFRWSADEGMIKVNDYRTADDVTNDGVVVGGDGADVAFRWEDGVTTVIGDLTTIGRTEDSPGGTNLSSAHGVSADGRVIVGNTSTDENGEADSFRIIGDVIEPIGDFPGGPHTSGIRSVSADGTIAVGYGFTDAGREAMRWENGIRESLGDLEGGELFSWANKVSANGEVIVGRSQSATGTQVFRWTRETGMVGLGYILGAATNDSRAWDLSGDGSIVVGVHNNSLTPEFRNALIWDEVNGMRDLQLLLETEHGLAEDLAGWDFIQARAISDDGSKVVGAAFNPDGLIEGFLVDIRPVPEPAPSATAWFAIVVMGYLVVGRRRKRRKTLPGFDAM